MMGSALSKKDVFTYRLRGENRGVVIDIQVAGVEIGHIRDGDLNRELPSNPTLETEGIAETILSRLLTAALL